MMLTNKVIMLSFVTNIFLLPFLIPNLRIEIII